MGLHLSPKQTLFNDCALSAHLSPRNGLLGPELLRESSAGSSVPAGTFENGHGSIATQTHQIRAIKPSRRSLPTERCEEPALDTFKAVISQPCFEIIWGEDGQSGYTER